MKFMRLMNYFRMNAHRAKSKRAAHAKRVIAVATAICLLGASASYAATTASSITVKDVGYGVKDLTIYNPFTSCSISCNSSVTKGSSITISFSSKYAKTKNAKGTFKRDGYSKGTHEYKSTAPSYSWSIKKDGKKVASGTKSSYTFTPSSTGTYTVSCAATLTAKPNPATAAVGITNWTETKMPSQDFSIGAADKSFTVKAASSSSSTKKKDTPKTDTSKKKDTSKSDSSKTKDTSKTDTKKTDTTKKEDKPAVTPTTPTKPSTPTVTPTTPTKPSVTPTKPADPDPPPVAKKITKLVYTFKLHRAA